MRALVFAASLLAAPVAAQDRMTQTQCLQMFGGIMAMAQMDVAIPDIEASEAGWCVATDVKVPVGDISGVWLGTLEWRVSDVQRFLDDGLPPRGLEVIGRDAGMYVSFDDPVLDYLYGLQSRQAGIDFGLTARWDGVQKAVIVSESYVDFNETNRIEASARIDGVDLTDGASIQGSLGRAALSNISMMSNFDGWFETLLAIPVGTTLLDAERGTPEAQIAQLQRQAIDFLQQIPETTLPEASREALSNFINALPRPRGTARLNLAADPGIGAARAMGLAALSRDATVADIVEAALEGVDVSMTWTGEAAQ